MKSFAKIAAATALILTVSAAVFADPMMDHKMADHKMMSHKMMHHKMMHKKMMHKMMKKDAMMAKPKM